MQKRKLLVAYFWIDVSILFTFATFLVCLQNNDLLQTTPPLLFDFTSFTTQAKKKTSACVTVCINTNPLLLRATVTAPALWICRCRQKIGIGMPYLFSTHKKGGTLKSFKLTSVSLISSTQTRQKWTVNAAFRNKWQGFLCNLVKSTRASKRARDNPDWREGERGRSHVKEEETQN